jgi:hypothetical protein
MTFTFRPAVRESTPALIGAVGPSGSGKTLSALRLATGMQRVRGGNIVAIDTEARRMLHYAEHFKFLHLEFTPPFGSDRYAEAIKAAAAEAKGGVVIVDSMSHEHEGPGGYLDYHEQEVKRLVDKGGFRNEMAAQIPAWNRPAQRRRLLINTILQINCAFVFCFRAKEKLQIKKGDDPKPLGWQAIAGDEFVYEMTARCLLLPGAAGVPDWSDEAFRLGVPKLPKSLRHAFENGKQLDEATGEKLARWASGELNRERPRVPVAAATPASSSEAAGQASAEEATDGTAA